MAERTHYPLTLTIVPRAAVALEWSWDGARVERAALERIAGQYVRLLEQLASGVSRVGDLTVADEPAAAVLASYDFAPVAGRIGSSP